MQWHIHVPDILTNYRTVSVFTMLVALFLLIGSAATRDWWTADVPDTTFGEDLRVGPFSACVGPDSNETCTTRKLITSFLACQLIWLTVEDYGDFAFSPKEGFDETTYIAASLFVVAAGTGTLAMLSGDAPFLHFQVNTQQALCIVEPTSLTTLLISVSGSDDTENCRC